MSETKESGVSSRITITPESMREAASKLREWSSKDVNVDPELAHVVTALGIAISGVVVAGEGLSKASHAAISETLTEVLSGLSISVGGNALLGRIGVPEKLVWSDRVLPGLSKIMDWSADKMQGKR